MTRPTVKPLSSLRTNERAVLIGRAEIDVDAADPVSVEDTLAADFRFTSPYDDHLDKATYFERCWRDTGWITSHDIERIFVHGDEAFVTYRCLATDGRSFRNTEFLTFVGGKVRRIEVYFGAAYLDGRFAPQPR